MQTEIESLLPQSKGQLGLVAGCLADGITDRRLIVDSGAAASTGAVGNILATVYALRDGTIPENGPTVARMAASSARSFLKQHRERLSPEAVQRITSVIDNLAAAAGNRLAQEREEAELQERGDGLEEVLAAQGGVYAYTFPHYWRYPTVEGSSRTLLKVGMTTKDAHVRVRQQARHTGLPEDPLLLRVYQHPTRDPRDLEKDFHDLLDAADHGRTDTKIGGREWFETSVEFLDMVAKKLGMTVRAVEQE
ncbi:MAG: GIY-YIG nuclease family protein [Acidimicrobiales bacterium]